MDLIPNLSLTANLALFAALAAAIWFAGTRLSHLADAIGDKTGAGQAIMGLIFLAAITELPELVTTSAAALGGNAALALNNMFGGITMQTAILVVADAAALHVTLTSFPRKSTPVLEAALLILLLAAVLAVATLGDVALIGWIGAGVVLFAAIYCAAIVVLDRYDSAHPWRPIDLPDMKEETGPMAANTLRGRGLSALALESSIVGLVILVCGVALVEVCEGLAEQTGLGSSFIGATLLATTTSLPELSTTIAAVRMGAYTMAISNIFGSNLIMVLVLFPADIFYRDGLILNQIDGTAKLALLSGILVTAIYMIGLLVRRKPRVFGIGLDSLIVLIVYAVSVWAFYAAR